MPRPRTMESHRSTRSQAEVFLPTPPNRRPALRRSPRNHNSTAPTNPLFSRKRPASDPVELPAVRSSKVDIHIDIPTKVLSVKRSLNNSLIPAAKRACLSKANLEFFNAIGKDDGRSAKPSKSKSSKSKSPNSKSSKSDTTKSISTTNPKFEEQALDNGILLEALSTPPTNMASLQDTLNRCRESESPTESRYQNYAHHISRADNEEAVTHTFYNHVMLPYMNDLQYSTGWNHAFSSFPTGVGFNNNLSPAQPDFVQGVEAPQFSCQIHETLGGAIKPYSAPFCPTLSHLAGEWKRPGKDLLQAQRQAAYDGACLVYGRNKALELAGTPDTPGQAYVQTFASDGTILETYANYSANNNGRVEYHHSTTSRTLLINPADKEHRGFATGYRVMRNAQTDARNSSRAMLDLLNENGFVKVADTDNTESNIEQEISGDVVSSPNSTVSYDPVKPQNNEATRASSNIDGFPYEHDMQERHDSMGQKRKNRRTSVNSQGKGKKPRS